jgi:hypothetical protein
MYFAFAAEIDLPEGSDQHDPKDGTFQHLDEKCRFADVKMGKGGGGADGVIMGRNNFCESEPVGAKSTKKTRLSQGQKTQRNTEPDV